MTILEDVLLYQIQTNTKPSQVLSICYSWRKTQTSKLHLMKQRSQVAVLLLSKTQLSNQLKLQTKTLMQALIILKTEMQVLH